MYDLSKGLNPRDIVMRRIHAIDTMVALSRRQEVQCHKSRLSKSSSISSLEESPKSYDRRMRKFSKPDKMMDHVERHLEKRTPGKYECSHPVCKAEGLLLNNIILFKNHVEVQPVAGHPQTWGPPNTGARFNHSIKAAKSEIEKPAACNNL
ncbi:hypothetical protein VE03_04522 [Pseudogymnoascus sp. 23342-1-I1]|nr:hypothetical protein VE03_04522 [Pseudogymnoascus sp. 23342-1-I1]